MTSKRMNRQRGGDMPEELSKQLNVLCDLIKTPEELQMVLKHLNEMKFDSVEGSKKEE